VRKRDAPSGALARVERAEGGLRVEELARLLSGRETDAALRRASELLDEGGGARRDRTRAPALLRTI
ncbi:MAG: hypothetical protein JOZ75_00895, partial [Candidatus Dormibacteraeota bacterium]|nr:hypothetical protein [Candidatus Dormibacteraeota bacterium]